MSILVLLLEVVHVRDSSRDNDHRQDNDYQSGEPSDIVDRCKRLDLASVVADVIVHLHLHGLRNKRGISHK